LAALSPIWSYTPSSIKERDTINFEQFANSELVQQERKCRLAGVMSGCSDLPGERIRSSNAVPQIDPKTGERIDLSAGLVPKQPGNVDYDALARKYGGTSEQKEEHGPWEKYAEKDKTGVVLDWSRSIPLPSELKLNKSGIKAINWSHDFGVESIETEDGQTLSPEPAPNPWLYLFAAVLPLVGFAIPWGLVRTAWWVGEGFVTSPK